MSGVPFAVRSAPGQRSGARERPFQSHLELGALPTAVPCARMHAKQVVIEWGLAELADTTELLVSELTTNAVRASAGLTSPIVRLRLVSDGRCVVIHVGDGSSQMPVRQDAGPDSERGRGLLLVDTLAEDWGAYRTAGGKVVWVLAK